MTHGAVVLLFLAFIGLALAGAWSISLLRAQLFRRVRGRWAFRRSPPWAFPPLTGPDAFRAHPGLFWEDIS
mgnify:CR=1 FL=1